MQSAHSEANFPESIQAQSTSACRCRCQPRFSLVTSSLQNPPRQFLANLRRLSRLKFRLKVRTSPAVSAAEFRRVNTTCFGWSIRCAHHSTDSLRSRASLGAHIGQQWISHLLLKSVAFWQPLQTRKLSSVWHFASGVAWSNRSIETSFATMESLRMRVFSQSSACEVAPLFSSLTDSAGPGREIAPG